MNARSQTLRRTCPLRCSAGIRQVGVRNGFHLNRCSACSHLFTSNLPDQAAMDEHYRRYSYDHRGLETVKPFIFDRLDEVIAPLESYRRTNRLLDVGFGAGAMLKVAQRRGWQAFGIERSALAVEQAIKNGFPDVQVGDLANGPYPADHFDVIVMSELIEHLDDPQPYLRQAWRCLRPGGVLYLTTPNGAGISGRLLSANWSVVCPPEHLQLFSPVSLRRSLQAGGFQNIVIHAEGVNPYEVGRFLFQRTKGGPVSNGNVAKPYKSVSLNERMVTSRWGSIVKRLANTGLRTVRMGDALKAWAVKTAH